MPASPTLSTIQEETKPRKRSTTHLEYRKKDYREKRKEERELTNLGFTVVRHSYANKCGQDFENALPCDDYVKVEPGDGDGDLGDFCLPIFLSREDCERQYPGEKIGVIMFGIYEN